MSVSDSSFSERFLNFWWPDTYLTHALNPHHWPLYSEAILWELEILAGFILDSDNLYSIIYADDAVLIENIERELKELLQKVVM